MAGSRETKYIDLLYHPGVVTNQTDRDAKGRYKDSNRVRWHKGLPEKIGGWVRQTLSGANNGVYIGVARALHDWSSLDGQQWIVVGTHCKLYLVSKNRLYDITPRRKTSNVTNPLSVTIGSNVITVTDPNHRLTRGDHVTITASSDIGGFAVSGDYDVESIIDENRYTVHFTQNFNSTQTGGGGTSIEYDIGCGLALNGERLGYGTHLYGDGTYGTRRGIGTGVPAKMRTWSVDNWGEDLVAAPGDGGIYWWDKSLGPNTHARRIENAPDGVQRILVSVEARHLIALGCTGYDGKFDPMRIRWCASEDLDDWQPNDEDTAGGRRLDYGSRLITGIRTRSSMYVWSDTQMYSLQYAAPDDFIPNALGACKIVGPNAAIDVNGVVYAMVFDDFTIFDGTLRVLPCDVHTKIFGDEDRNIEGDFDRTQAEGVYCASYMPKNEVTWFYPTTDGQVGYVTFNSSPGKECWYYGRMPRTAYHDVSEAITGYKTNPYGANGGYLYKHEVGTDEVEGATTTPQAWFLETYDNNIGGSDAVFLINGLIPNFDRMSGSMLVTLKKKAKPRQPTYQLRGPYLIEEDTLEKGVRCKASQVAIRFESNNELGEDWRMGVWQILGTPYGGRVGSHSEDVVLPSAVVLSGEIIEEESCEIYSLNETMSVVPPLVNSSDAFVSSFTIDVTALDDGNTNRMLVIEIVAPNTDFADIASATIGGQPFDVELVGTTIDSCGVALLGSLIDANAIPNTDGVYEVVCQFVGGSTQYEAEARVSTFGNVGGVFYEKIAGNNIVNPGNHEVFGSDGSAYTNTMLFSMGAISGLYSVTDPEVTTEVVVPAEPWTDVAGEDLRVRFNAGEEEVAADSAYIIGAGFEFEFVGWDFGIVGSGDPETIRVAVAAFGVYSVCDTSGGSNPPEIIAADGVSDPDGLLVEWTPPTFAGIEALDFYNLYGIGAIAHTGGSANFAGNEPVLADLPLVAIVSGLETIYVDEGASNHLNEQFAYIIVAIGENGTELESNLYYSSAPS